MTTRSHAGKPAGRRIWILTALGKDRPGIVADVTRTLFELGGNLEDSSMTRLGGEFTIMLAFSAPASVTVQRLEQAFAKLSTRLRLAVHLKSLTSAEAVGRQAAKPYLISVYGADQPGIVYHVSSLLAALKINILDVSTHRAPQGKEARPLYLLLLEVEVPAGVKPGGLEERLRRLAKRLGVEVSLRADESAVL